MTQIQVPDFKTFLEEQSLPEKDPKNRKIPKKPLVIYHSGCPDGSASAYIFFKMIPGAEFFPAAYGKEPPKEVTGKDLILADFSYPRNTLERLRKEARSIVVLDHHKTAEDQLKELDFAEFNMSKCGTTMVQWYLKLPPHWFMDYIEDRDLWKFDLPESAAIHACVSSFATTNPEDWEPLAEMSFASMLKEGKAIERFRRREINLLKKSAHEVTIAGEKVLAANCTSKDLLSEVAGELSEGRKFGAVYYLSEGKFILWSLRTRDETFDVSEIAKKFSGGGHKAAAAFRRKIDDPSSLFGQNE